ncbi:type II toxin-antitoxin system PemK/MazF family toxin [Sphingomonas sp.]|uniref:type II toxin-antitoxin system PemK/MazF family toxin n=1 Tax=Sphingomonas sp. TaxID=28214 RepID=UPI0035BBC6FE
MLSDTDVLAFGDVVLVPFPFTDQSGVKRRPAVVISAALANDTRPDVILMPITSQTREQAGGRDLMVGAWSEAGLLKPSAIKPVMATLERALILRRLGLLQAVDRDALRRALAALIGG